MQYTASTLSVAARHAAAVTPPPTPRPHGSQAVACEGKAHRGRLHFTPAAPGVSVIHEVSPFCTDVGTVLTAVAVTATDDKAAELNSAPALLAQVNWVGRVLTGDGLWCQRPLSEKVVAASGDYLFTVKATCWIVCNGGLHRTRPAALATLRGGWISARRRQWIGGAGVMKYAT